MNTENHEHDRLVARLRSGLDEFTSSVRRDPPDLDAPTAAATDGLEGGSGRGRWITSAAAAAFVVAAVGAIVWVAADDTRTAAPPTQPTTAPAGQEKAGTFGTGDDPVASDDLPAIFYDDTTAGRILPLYGADATLTVDHDCVVLETADGARRIPVWPEDIVLTDDAVWFANGTAIALDKPFTTDAGAGVVRQEDERDWETCRAATGADDTVWLISTGPLVADGTAPPPSVATKPVPLPVPDGTVAQIATVLESPDHGPQLCNAVAESYPPQCGGADIVGWDWSAVDGEESAGGTTWGEYVIGGTYNADGTVFTLTGPARTPTPEDYEQQQPPEPDYSTPCAEPDGGWNSPYPDEELNEGAVRRAVETFGGMWIDEATGVYNVKVVGDTAAQEAARDAIAEFYSGPICIVEGTHTMSELTRIQNAVTALADPRVIAVGTDVLTGQVRVDLSTAAPELEDELSAQYGDAIAFNYAATPVLEGDGSEPNTGTGTVTGELTENVVATTPVTSD